jgi:hypothetical protein
LQKELYTTRDENSCRVAILVLRLDEEGRYSLVP